MMHHRAVFVDKVIKGSKPDQIPTEQPTKFRLVITAVRTFRDYLRITT